MGTIMRRLPRSILIVAVAALGTACQGETGPASVPGDAIDLIVSDVVSDVFDIDARVDRDVVADNPACVITLDQPTPTGGKEAEFVTVDVPAGENCTVSVHLVTVPAPGTTDMFEPLFAAVRPVGSTHQIVDTFSLNEGAKVFGAPPTHPAGIRLSGPVGSLQLNLASPIPDPFPSGG